MIVLPKRLTWLKTLLRYQGTVFSKVMGRVAFTTALACAVTYLHMYQGWFKTSLTHLPFTFVGLALSIFLGFRNSTSYDRFWEGRKLLGQLVNTTRSLSRQTLSYMCVSSDSQSDLSALKKHQSEMHDYLIAYVHAFRYHLRDESIDGLRSYLSDLDYQRIQKHQNRPNFIMHRLSEMISHAWKSDWLSLYHVPMFEDRIHELSNLQGGCERIKATPIPSIYIVFLHRLVAVYSFSLPFGIVDKVGFYTPFVVFMVAYAFLGLDAIGDSIENPFEKEPHDLPLRQISKNIELALRQQQEQQLVLLSDQDEPLTESQVIL